MVCIDYRKDKKGQAVLEFSLLVVTVIFALLAIQGFVSRAHQGRTRSSTDSVAEQFSAGYTNVSSVTIVDSTVEEQSTPASITRTIHQQFSSTRHKALDSYAAEIGL